MKIKFLLQLNRIIEFERKTEQKFGFFTKILNKLRKNSKNSIKHFKLSSDSLDSDRSSTMSADSVDVNKMNRFVVCGETLKCIKSEQRKK